MKARLPQGMGKGPGSQKDMLRQVQKMQQDMEAKQAELEAKEYDIAAGGGVCKIKINGKKEIAKINVFGFQKSLQSRYLAGCTRKKYKPIVRNIGCYFIVNTRNIRLYVFRAAHKVTIFRLCGADMNCIQIFIQSASVYNGFFTVNFKPFV